MTQGGSTAESTLMATCSRCGDVVVDVRRTRVGRGDDSRSGWYSFQCPGCLRPVRIEAADHLVSVLVCLGSVLVCLGSVESLVGSCSSVEGSESWRGLEGTPRSSAPPLTLDDVLDAALALHRTDDLVALARGLGI